jgi:hypothetical protein
MYPDKPFIDRFYQAVRHNASQDIHSRSDSYLISVNVNDYATYLVEKFGLQEIIVDEDKDITIKKNRKMIEHEDFGQRIRSEHLYVEICLPVEPNKDIPQILDLTPSTYSLRQPEMWYRDGCIFTGVSANEVEVKRALNDLKDEVARRNKDIKSQNQQLRENILLWIENRKKQIENEDALLDQISQKVSVTLHKKADPSTIIPPILKVKEKLRSIVAPTASPPVKLELKPEKFFAILNLIDNNCRLFERTPRTFSKMEEEELRDVILSNLNSVYEGNAVGEAFSKKGKTDIYLNVDKGGIFIAECKYWSRIKTVDESVKQLLGYLTWRNSYGVIIIFSKRIGFTKVVDTVYQRISQVPLYLRDLKKIDETHFTALFSLPEDEHKLVELHFLIYNLCDNSRGHTVMATNNKS